MACSFVPRLRLSHSSTRLRGSSKEDALCCLSEFKTCSSGLLFCVPLAPVSSFDASAQVIKRERLITPYVVYLICPSYELRSNGLPSRTQFAVVSSFDVLVRVIKRVRLVSSIWALLVSFVCASSAFA